MAGAACRFVLRRAALAAAIACALAAPAFADSVSTSTSGGYARLLFVLDPPAQVTARVVGAVLEIAFDRKVAIAPSAIVRDLPAYVASGRADPDGKTFRFVLNGDVRLHTSTSTDKTAVDLLPPRYAGTPPNLPPPAPPPRTAVDVAKLPPLAIRTGSYRHYTRVVFEWPRQVPYAVFPGAGKLTVRFEAEAKPDFSALTRQAPPWVKAAGWRIENGGTVVELQTDASSGHRDFREGTRIVVDVEAPKTDADAVRAAGDKDKHTAAVSTAQVQAIADAANKLNGTPAKPADTKPAPVPNEPPPPAEKAEAAAAETPPAPPPTQEAGGQLTHQGVVLTFPGAGRRGSAVFMRGLTAWIVLQDAQPLDAAKLKAQLGSFPQAVDAASSDNVSVLRLSLKQPEQIAAIAEGALLKVVIAPQAASSATAIGFARNQDDPLHSSLSTLLPGATKPVMLVDPVAGDQLTVIPGAAGSDMASERTFVDFSALQTASGIVLLPFVDDLSVTVDATRVTITRSGGLALSAPTMSVSAMPEALAGNGKSPCFLDFAAWKAAPGGSFLAVERRLRAATARLKPQDANHARLVLARFYIANGFAAEALGLVSVIQQSDPALQSDLQLQTIRAAADYQMGRYRDAHNAIAGAEFDGDRHAALWRGLIEAALQDWGNAHTDLERAMPVVDQYQPELQARVRLANADAALAIGRLEIADAQLSRLPHRLDRPLMLAAALDRARLYAAEHRRRDADRLFAVVETSGNERLASEAIYYRVTAALAAGTMSRVAATNALERLRFRWRGDLLELNTLRKLAALHFAQQQWRDGLRTLRIAVQNFPNEDTSGQAQDDMRAAFVDLFLKGKADAMPPVEALALFYDFIDLTPIGPDGDEMIRRMADRLVKVDLLGPAADLLNYQITKRLDGVARAQVATKLAMVQLMDHKPQAAILTLRSTRISTLPDDVAHERLLLEARALADERQWDQAIDLLGVDQAPDTLRLKSNIYWQSGNWAVAAKNAEDSLGSRWSDAAPLSPEERQEAMRAAVAYSLANDETSLERVRDHFAAKMKGTADANVFAVVTQRIDMQGMAFRAAAAQVASIDTLTAFMKDLQSHPIAD